MVVVEIYGIQIAIVREKSMRTMKALVYEKPGRAYGAVKEVPYPVCGQGQIIIKVMSCGICKPAERSHDGAGSVLGRYPATPGHEFAGTVEEVGPGVSGFAVGDRVTADNGVPCGHCYYCQKGQPSYCLQFGSLGHNLPGGMAQYVAVDAQKAFHIPPGVSMNAACLSELVGCCYQCVERSGLQYGDDVLILGCGSSGMLLAQLFLHSSAGSVTVADRIPAKLGRIREKGIDTVLLSAADGGLPESLFAAKHPLGFDRIVDTTGHAELLSGSVALLKRGGTLVGYSFATTPRRGVQLDMGEFIVKELTYVGSTFQSHHFERCLQAMQGGKVDPESIITGEYPLARYFEALDENLANENSVKIIIHPNEE